MKLLKLNNWSKLNQWLDQYPADQKQFAFRGQANSEWVLQTRLARHFRDHPGHVATNEWRKRELKMYRNFREQLVEICPGRYDEWSPLNVLSLMQHYGAPTRLLDFSYDPNVAAYFALHDSRGDSAIWVIDGDRIEKRRKEIGLAPDAYCGPKHDPYEVFYKDEEGKYREVGLLLPSTQSHDRLAAQRGCFFMPGAISKIVDSDLVYMKVTLSKALAVESAKYLKKSRDMLFPDLEQFAKRAKRHSVIGGPDSD